MSDLNRLLRTTAKACLAFGPLPTLIQSMRNRRCLSIVTYHSVIQQPLPFYDWSFLDVTEFRKQIDYLKKHFRLLPLSSAIEQLKADALEAPTATITFDDGFQNNYDVAFPILQEYQAPFTVFLTTDYINTTRTVWFTRLISALAGTKCIDLFWDEKHYSLTNRQEKAESSARLQTDLKAFPAVRLEKELAKIEALLLTPPYLAVPQCSPFRMLDQSSIKAMVASGLVEFGAHTCGHTILSRLSSAEKSVQIGHSIRQVEEFTGKKCTSFAYPNGGQKDFDAESQRLLSEAGIRVALTMVSGANRSTTPPLELHRYPIGSDTRFSRFKLMVHNIG